MEIQIPSPSVFLAKSPEASAVPISPTRKPAKPRGTNRKKIIDNAAVNKVKQTKSRNGCGTCKKKRLKCDETKPGCTQCQKRNVECEGYKKEYKWRDFKESTFTTAKPTAKKRDSSKEQPWVPSLDSAFASASTAFQDDTTENLTALSPADECPPETFESMLPELSFDDARIDLPSPGSAFTIDATSLPSARDFDSTHSSTMSGSPSLYNPLAHSKGSENADAMVHSAEEEEEVDEEVSREPRWLGRRSSPALSDASNATKSTSLSLLAGPALDISSPDMLLAHFDRSTCGILSVKDGPTENPWRTLIWPLAQDSQALYHAISAMTAFHGAYDIPQLRVAGVAHMLKSIRSLSDDICNMRIDAALATSLALAFSEGWDEKISTGIQHLRGAKIMVNNALVKHQHDLHSGQLTPQDAVRLKFLCHTFIYLDVIARLTSHEDSQPFNFDDLLLAVNPPTGDLVEVDPLMGCATTLFPLIGQVASLVQRVRRTGTNSLSVASQAMDLKERLIRWETPDHCAVERPEDPSSEVQHAIQTAEAYRFATLLYLHHAVPEIPSETSEWLAKKVLFLLAGVPPSSRTTIVQIFPLFAASCEVTLQEDREWVTERWMAMISRLHIGNVDHCWEVVQEVWRRRDEFENEKAQRLVRRYTSRGLPTGGMMPEGPMLTRRATASDLPLNQMEAEYTVRGRLHWIGVMNEWNWEVFLG